MPESAPQTGPVPATGTVHWIGAGLSTGSGLRVLAERASHVTLLARTQDKAAARLSQLGLSGQVAADAYDPQTLRAAVKPGDVVVSMLPAAEHARLLRLCVERGAHFACTSYVSEAISDEVPAAERAGIAVLTEAGLDPGIDHLLAHELVARARAAAGDGPATASFTSYCGGIPAVPNDFKYRFSWAPRGVLSALLEPARYIGDGREQDAPRPWEALSRHPLGGEVFEVYPNRDSIPFVSQYFFPYGWRLDTFVRGTIRLEGWSDAWAGVFAELRSGDKQRIDALARELAARYPVTDDDRDRVVLAVALSVRPDGGQAWSGQYLIDLTGDDADSAMARCVSVPLAFGITEILGGRMSPGLHRAAETAQDARRWLDFLAGQGIEARFTRS
jgi:Saccharopine dehydrogenase C-terminal domain/Saccharopine dehydrogenase NADP binding domain